MKGLLLFWGFTLSTAAQLSTVWLTQIVLTNSSPLPRKSTVSATTNLPRFEDIAQRAGLTVPHISSPDKKYIVESMSGGVGLIDCDNDGQLDIIAVNGSTVPRYRQGGDPMITPSWD